MRRLQLSCILVSCVFAFQAKAEYRVYELLITDTATGKTRTTIGTLDDQQYRSYYLVKPTETVTLQTHWMCRPRKDYFGTYCPNPNSQTSTKGPV